MSFVCIKFKHLLSLFFHFWFFCECTVNEIKSHDEQGPRLQLMMLAQASPARDYYVMSFWSAKLALVGTSVCKLEYQFASSVFFICRKPENEREVFLENWYHYNLFFNLVVLWLLMIHTIDAYQESDGDYEDDNHTIPEDSASQANRTGRKRKSK